MTRWTIACMLAALLVAPPLVQAHEEGKKGQRESLSPEGHASALGRPGDPGTATRSIRVEMSDSMRFKPDKVTVKRGETVRFIVHNAGKLEHEMVLGTEEELKEHAALMRKFPEMEHDDPNGVSVEPGKSEELTWKFTNPGTFEFACLVPGHFEDGMVGKVIVTR